MKRLSNLVISSEDIGQGQLNKIKEGGYTFYGYSNKLYSYDKVYLVRSEIELPYVDLYECKGLSKQGVICGFVFDVFCKEPIVEKNCIVAKSKGVNIRMSDLIKQRNYLKLNYKMRGCFIFTLSGFATVLTVNTDKELKRRMEL